MALNSSRRAGADKRAAGDDTDGTKSSPKTPDDSGNEGAGKAGGAPPPGNGPAPASRAGAIRKAAEEAWAAFGMGPAGEMEPTLLRPLTDAAAACWEDPKALEKLAESRLQAAATASASVAIRADFFRRRSAAVAEQGAQRRSSLMRVAKAARTNAKRAAGHAALSRALHATVVSVCARMSVSASAADTLSARVKLAFEKLHLPGRQKAAEAVAARLKAAAEAAAAVQSADEKRQRDLRAAFEEAWDVAEAAAELASKCARRAGLPTLRVRVALPRVSDLAGRRDCGHFFPFSLV